MFRSEPTISAIIPVEQIIEKIFLKKVQIITRESPGRLGLIFDWLYQLFKSLTLDLLFKEGIDVKRGYGLDG